MILSPQEKRSLDDRLALSAAYTRLFESPDGITVLEHLMKQGFIMKTTFVRGDPYETALNEGSRRMVLAIMESAKKTPQMITQQLEQLI